MKKIAVVFLLFSILLIGCTSSKKSDSDITTLQAEIDVLNSQIEKLKQDKEKQASRSKN